MRRLRVAEIFAIRWLSGGDVMACLYCGVDAGNNNWHRQCRDESYRRVSAGLCVRCGKNKVPDPPGEFCNNCNDSSPYVGYRGGVF